MPDPTRQSVSASQMAALFNVSPYCTRYMLWHHFKSGAPLPEPTHKRIGWGLALQSVIILGVAEAYRLEILSNLQAAEYVRRGRVGHTRDGLMLAPDIGHYVVEAKNVDYFVWKSDWTEVAAPQHIEIQLQVGIYADNAGRGVIGALIGGNNLLLYEREPNPEFVERMEKETADFFQSLEDNVPPPVTGDPIELPMLSHLYPTADPAVIVEDLLSKEKRDMLREFKYAREQQSFWATREDQLKPQVLALAQGAGVLRVNGLECRISKIPIQGATIVRKPHIQTRFKFVAREGDPAVEDDILFGGKELAP